MVDFFHDVRHLKVNSKEEIGNIKYISFNGENLPKNPLVSDLISKAIFNVSEIGGMVLINGSVFYLYINNKGRIVLRGDPDYITSTELDSLFGRFEQMQSHLLK